MMKFDRVGDRVSCKCNFEFERCVIMTLAEVLPAARRLSATEKLRLIRILAEDLDTAEDIAPLEPFKTYDLPTPYDCYGAGAVLMETLKQPPAGQQ
jgi:hypothetical protein